ncbi:MAG: sigma-70 family RNA polymerase sigma factor [Candidatus Gracilibacteria bacterium]|nr:sigma-70 family RNA polymerase sigma factor [Candidatus Gracilibacteria bacterium]
MIDCSNKSDKDIIKLVSSGNIDAFYCIVEKYEEKLLKYILRITNIDLSDAENLLQEVFIKVYKNINEFDDGLTFSSWIYRIAHNTTIDYYRKNKDKKDMSMQTEDEDYVNLIELLESPINIEEEYKKKDLIKKIVETINLLDPKYKEVIILKFLEEKNYSEISDILKIPEGTVATLINRGKKQFKIKAEENNLSSYL